MIGVICSRVMLNDCTKTRYHYLAGSVALQTIAFLLHQLVKLLSTRFHNHPKTLDFSSSHQICPLQAHELEVNSLIAILPQSILCFIQSARLTGDLNLEADTEFHQNH